MGGSSRLACVGVSVTPSSRWRLGSRGGMVALRPAILGLWTGHPAKRAICFLPDQVFSRAGSQLCQSLAHSRASLSSRALDPSTAGPSTAPKPPPTIFASSATAHLATQANAIALESCVSPTSTALVGFHLRKLLLRPGGPTAVRARPSGGMPHNLNTQQPGV